MNGVQLASFPSLYAGKSPCAIKVTRFETLCRPEPPIRRVCRVAVQSAVDRGDFRLERASRSRFVTRRNTRSIVGAVRSSAKARSLRYDARLLLNRGSTRSIGPTISVQRASAAIDVLTPQCRRAADRIEHEHTPFPSVRTWVRRHHSSASSRDVSRLADRFGLLAAATVNRRNRAIVPGESPSDPGTARGGLGSQLPGGTFRTFQVIATAETGLTKNIAACSSESSGIGTTCWPAQRNALARCRVVVRDRGALPLRQATGAPTVGDTFKPGVAGNAYNRR